MMDAAGTLQKHKALLSLILLTDAAGALTDFQSLIKKHQFVRDDLYDEDNKGDWELRLARRYYDRLFKEYAILSLERYKENKIGMRWRTEVYRTL